MLNFKEFSQLEEDLLFEMANFRSKSTGLPMNIYVSTGEVEGKKMKHGPRIKVSKTYSNNFTPFDTFSLTIAKEPEVIGDVGEIEAKDIQKAKQFILLNFETLLAYWDGEYDTSDLIGNISKVKER